MQFSGCTLSGGSATNGGAMYVINAAQVTLQNVNFAGNTANTGGSFYMNNVSLTVLSTITTDADMFFYAGSTAELSGTIKLTSFARLIPSGLVTITSGTVLDFSSSGRETPFLEQGSGYAVVSSCTVIPYGGGDPVTINGGTTYTKINRDGTTA
jgi:predicted outer membrane repeat protein